MQNKNCQCATDLARHRCKHYDEGQRVCDKPYEYYKGYWQRGGAVIVYNKPMTEAQALRLCKVFPLLRTIHTPTQIFNFFNQKEYHNEEVLSKQQKV